MTTASTSQPALAARPTGRAAVVAWLLPFVTVGIAMTWHWLTAVPPGPLPPPVAKDPPPTKAPPAAKGDDDDDKDRDGFEPFTAPRADSLLVQLHGAYDGVDFKTEPTFEAWSVVHRPLLTQIVTAARMQLFKGVVPAPSVSTANVECHTIRCRFTLSSSKEEDLQSVLDALAELKLDGGPLWHTYKPDPIVEEPAKRAGAKARVKTTVTVSFIRDLPKVEQITLEDGRPLRPAAVTPKIAPGPGTTPPPGSSAVPPTSPAGAAPTAIPGAAPTKPVPSDSSTAPGRTTTPVATAPTGSRMP